PITTRKGTKPLVSRRITGPFFTTSIDVQRTTASFANSEGWREAPNTYLREPWIRGAIVAVNGRITTTSRTIVSAIKGHAHFSHSSASVLAAIANNTTPAAIPVSCPNKR